MAAIKEIEQNTDYLADDIVRLEEERENLEKAIDEMFDAVRTLDTMWDGPANDAFRTQFQSDYETCKEMHKSLKALIGNLQTAKDEYDKCEAAVSDLVKAIRI